MHKTIPSESVTGKVVLHDSPLDQNCGFWQNDVTDECTGKHSFLPKQNWIPEG